MSDNPTSQYPIKRISSEELCRRFNNGGYWQRVKSGDLTETVLERRVSTHLTSETVEIISEMISYRDKDGREVARIHQFRRPDGSLAASGKPDPKRLLQDGILYRLPKKAR